MKNVNKPLCYLLTVFLIINCFLFSVSASDNSFYVSESVIIISENSSNTDKFAAEKLNKDLYNDFVAMGVTRFGEWQGHDLSDNDLRHLTRRIFTWITLYDEPIWDALNPFALKLYKALENLY